MGWTLGGYQCLDPDAARAAVEQLRYPRGHWYARANCFINPIGQGPARGIVLMLRRDVDLMDLNAFHDLEIADDKGGTQLAKNLLVTRYSVITPGARGDPLAACAVEIADKRHLARMTAVDESASYNVRILTDPANYSAMSRNGGLTWTWDSMLGDLWADSHWLGAWPGLPLTPDGVPEGWRFFGGSPYLALCRVLDHLSCAVAWDAATDAYSVVRVASGGEPSALASRDNQRIWDGEPDEPTLARCAGKVRVFFPKLPAAPDDAGFTPLAQPFTFKDVTAGAPTGSSPSTVHIIHDELPARYLSGASGYDPADNDADLAARALALAADYFRRASLGRLDRLYSGPLADAGLQPGSQIFTEGHYLRGTSVSDSPFAGYVTGVGRRGGLPDPLDAGIRQGSGQTIGGDGDAEGNGALALDQGAAVWWDNEERRVRSLVRAPGAAGIIVEQLNTTVTRGGVYKIQFEGLDGFGLYDVSDGVVKMRLVNAIQAGASVGTVSPGVQVSPAPIRVFGPSFTITTPSAGVGQIDLAGDSTSPGNSKAYSTDGAGVRGWHDFPTPSATLTIGSTAITGSTANGVLYSDGSVLRNVAPSAAGQIFVSGSLAWVTMSGDGTLSSAGILAITKIGGTAVTVDDDTTLSANSAAKLPTQHAVKSYVDSSVVGLLDFKGTTDCSASPNYPAASKGDAYVVSVAGKIGGASGTSVDVGDWYLAEADNAGGTEAAVGSSWGHIEHNLIGALLSANNLSDVASVSTSRANLGATTVGGNYFTLTNPSAVRFVRINADNTLSTLDAATFRSAIGAGTATGDVVGPSGATDNAIARFDGTTGKFVQDSSGATVADDNSITIGVTTASAGGDNIVAHWKGLCSTTPAAGLSLTHRMELQSTTQLRDAAYDKTEWVTATDASRKARRILSVWDTAEREVARLAATGSAAAIGFLGAAEAVRQTGDVGTALTTFGLMSGTPTFSAANLTGPIPASASGNVLAWRNFF